MTGFIPLNSGKHLYFPESNQIINAGLKDLYLRFLDKQKIGLKDISIDKEIIKSKLKHLYQIIFEITQNCNLDCKYCSYGDSYKYHRKSSPISLSLKTAWKAIDYLYSLISHRHPKKVSISFYGGEPLLKFNTVKKIASYSKEVFKDWEVTFAMTTNGTELNTDVIRFLVENNVNLMVSLDGSKKNHDTNRTFRNTKGSFDTVMNNLDKILRFDSSYYYQMVSFSVVYSKNLSIREVYDFFEKNDMVNKNSVSFAFVNQFDTNYYEKYPYDEALFKKDMNLLLEKIIDKKRNKKDLTPIDESFFKEINNLRKKLKRKSLTSLAETCLFDNRMYVDVYGQFHICEKMNHQFPIGNVEDGFYYDRMVQMLRDFSQLIKTNCTNCDFRFLCSRCFIHFAKDEKFVMSKEFCDKKKKSLIP